MDVSRPTGLVKTTKQITSEQIKTFRDRNVSIKHSQNFSSLEISPLEALPKELKLHILSFLSIDPRLINKEWRSLHLFRITGVTCIRFNWGEPSVSNLRYLKQLPNLQFLDLSHGNFKNIISLQKSVGRSLHNLIELRIGPKRISVWFLEKLQFEKLEVLYIDNAAIIDGYLEKLKEFKKLKTLFIGDAMSITDDGLQYLGDMPALEKFILQKCEKITSEGLKKIGFSEEETNLETGMSTDSYFSRCRFLRRRFNRIPKD